MTTPAPVRASRAVLSDPLGEPATLTLYGPDGALAAIVLGPAECVALAHDLLGSARLRYGRAPLAAPSATPSESHIALSPPAVLT